MLTGSECFLHRAVPSALFPVVVVLEVVVVVVLTQKSFCNPNCLSPRDPRAGIIDMCTRVQQTPPIPLTADTSFRRLLLAFLLIHKLFKAKPVRKQHHSGVSG